MPDAQRRGILERLHGELHEDTKARFRLIPQWSDNFIKHYHAQPEGLVLKTIGQHHYVGGKPLTWAKVKHHDTEDFVIMGYKHSTTKQGKLRIRSVVCGEYVGGMLVEVCSVGTMKLRVRHYLAEHPEECIGKVLEILHYGRTAKSLRHASVLRFRDDKLAADCAVAAMRAVELKKRGNRSESVEVRGDTVWPTRVPWETVSILTGCTFCEIYGTVPLLVWILAVLAAILYYPLQEVPDV
jgi:ATP-dependent DNA ligase